MEEIKNFINSHSSPNGCVALTRSERDELISMIEKHTENMKFKKCCGNCSDYYCSKDGKGRCNLKNPSFTVCGFNICERWRSAQ